jgi:ketohexokinase
LTTESRRGARILGVGIAVIDIVNRVAEYPPEDAEVRAESSRQVRGGNCANTLDVLAQLGRSCEWVGVLAGDDGAEFITTDLRRAGVACDHAMRHADGATPTSYITLSRRTGSRTIVHHRDLPELSAAEFASVPLAECDWIHFEGRNPEQTRRMVDRVRRERPELPVSMEIEKPRPGIDALLANADVIVFSRAYVEAQLPHRASRPEAALAELAALSDARLTFLPWGAGGAYGLARGDADCVFSPPRPPTRLRDSIGAGDVFNAAVIDGLIDTGIDAAATPHGLASLLARANALAGHKCGFDGLTGLVADAARAGVFEPAFER